MQNNEVLRRVRFATDLPDHKVRSMMGQGGFEVTAEELSTYLLRPTDDEFGECPDEALTAFLDGLISVRRGAREGGAVAARSLDNNLVFKKLRVAFSLKDDDIQNLLISQELRLTRSELNALFRAPEHKNFKACGDQVLKKFLTGLTHSLRPSDVDGGESDE